MLLAIDIGNTNIVLGVFNRKKLVFNWRLSTEGQRTADEYLLTLKGLLRQEGLKKDKIDGVVICSVVPKAQMIFKMVIERIFGNPPKVVGEDLHAGIRNLYRIPRQVGQDRLVNALGAFRIYGGPAIVVDFGTAITFDMVTSRGEYAGGIITPGLDISLRALYERTALLPRIELSKPGEFLGKDTVESMRSGIVYGFSALTDGLVTRLKKDAGRPCRVIATGGQAEFMAQYCRTLEKIDPHLTLQGLRIIYEES
jgi:type III pantothenate kinase